MQFPEHNTWIKLLKTTAVMKMVSLRILNGSGTNMCLQMNEALSYLNTEHFFSVYIIWHKQTNVDLKNPL